MSLFNTQESHTISSCCEANFFISKKWNNIQHSSLTRMVVRKKCSMSSPKDRMIEGDFACRVWKNVKDRKKRQLVDRCRVFSLWPMWRTINSSSCRMLTDYWPMMTNGRVEELRWQFLSQRLRCPLWHGVLLLLVVSSISTVVSRVVATVSIGKDGWSIPVVSRIIGGIILGSCHSSEGDDEENKLFEMWK